MQIRFWQKSASAARHGGERLLKNGREVARLRLLFLAPLTFTILAIVTMLMLALYWHEHQSVQQGVIVSAPRPRISTMTAFVTMLARFRRSWTPFSVTPPCKPRPTEAPHA